MNTRRSLPRSPSMCSVRAIVAALLLFVGGPFVLGQTPLLTSPSKTLPIRNGRLHASAADGTSVEDWRFEQRRAGLALVSDEERERTEATLVVAGEEGGILLAGTSDLARADLASAPFAVRPFRWVEAAVEYEVESGEPAVFVCLWPEGQRHLVSLAFLPRVGVGQRNTATVRVHTGLTQSDYVLSVSILGNGSARIFSIGAAETEPYLRPTKPVFVLDMLRAKPADNGKLGWRSIEKLVKVFGFPSIESLHYSEVTREKLKAIDPALIILSSKSAALSPSDMEEVLLGVRIAAKHRVPLVGICLGHQALAMIYPGTAGRQAREWGPTRIEAVDDDPIFEGLPRFPFFYVSESHKGAIDGAVPGAAIIGSSEQCPTQILHYTRLKRYTFQGHIERAWEDSCPEAYLLWENMLRNWGLLPDAGK